MNARLLVVAAACAGVAAFESAGSRDRVGSEAHRMSTAMAQLEIEGELPRLDGAKEWINRHR